MAAEEGINAGRRYQQYLTGIAVLLCFLLVALIWFAVFKTNPAPNYQDITVELLYVAATLVVYSIVWSLDIKALQIGGGLFLLGIYTDALHDFTLAPEVVDIYLCQGLQLTGVAMFVWGTYHHYSRLAQQVARLRKDLTDMEFRATHDPLTELPNRLLFRDRLLQAIAGAERRERQVAVLYIDLDNMKKVNDNYGHTTGDQLLKEIGKRLAASVRESDTVARLGGDEFAVIQTDISDRSDATRLADKLLQAINAGYDYQDQLIQAGASLGISLYPEHSKSVDTLLSLADSAMYEAKRSDKDCRIAVYENSAA